MDSKLLTEFWDNFNNNVAADKYTFVKFRKMLQSRGVEFDDVYNLSSIDESQQFRFLKDSYLAPESVSLHNHPFYEFVHCIKTNGTTYILGAKQYALQSGDLICITPGVNHRPVYPQNMTASFDRIILHVHEKFMKKIIEEYLPPENRNQCFEPVIRQDPARQNQTLRLFEKGYEELTRNKSPLGKLETLSAVIQILCLILVPQHKENAGFSKREKTDLMDDAIAWVDEHYSENVSLEKIAKALYQSPSTISHLFSSKMQTSFYRYVTERRLSESENLIRSGYALEEVSRQVGFSNYQTFFRAFKNYNGFSPSDYKKMSD